ncbi:MAG: hypothetical protein QXM52_03070 [Candidatus Bathyarchaeia archaeon]
MGGKAIDRGKGKVKKAWLLVVTLALSAVIATVSAVVYFSPERTRLLMESEPAESEPTERQQTHVLEVYIGDVEKFPIIEMLSFPLVNGSTIDWGELPSGVHKKRLSVQNNIRNNGNALVRIVLVVENLPEGWSLTSPEVNLTIIGTSVKIYGNLTLQIPSNAEAKDYELNLWIKAIRYEEREPPPRDSTFSQISINGTELAKLFFRLKLKVVQS